MHRHPFLAVFHLAFLLVCPVQAQEKTLRELDSLQVQFDRRTKTEGEEPFQKGVAELNTQYGRALDQALGDAQRNGKLDLAVKLRAEQLRVTSGHDMPEVDESDTPENLTRLRQTHRKSFSLLANRRDVALSVLRKSYANELNELITALTKQGRLDDALAVRARLNALTALNPAKAPSSAATANDEASRRVFTKSGFEKAVKAGTATWKLEDKGRITVHSSTYGLPGLLVIAGEGDTGALAATMRYKGATKLNNQGLVMCMAKRAGATDEFHGSPALLVRYREGIVEILDSIPYYQSPEPPKVLATGNVQVNEGETYTLQIAVSKGCEITVTLNSQVVLRLTTTQKFQGQAALFASCGEFEFENVRIAKSGQ